MFGLRQKLLLGFGGVLLIMIAIGVHSIVLLSEQRQAIAVLLKEDYRSIIACQEMRESLELLESAIEYALLTHDEESRELVRRNEERFEKALTAEFENINLPGEQEKAERLRGLYEDYRSRSQALLDPALPQRSGRRAVYISEIRPIFEEGVKTATEILLMNEVGMNDAGAQAEQTAARTVHRMWIMMVAGFLLSLVFILLAQRWILSPLKKLTQSTHEVEKDNLDLSLNLRSRDEIGQLANGFDAMTAHLRTVRDNNNTRLVRTRRATQLALDSLPDAVAVLNPDGEIEMANPTAVDLFALRPGLNAATYPESWLPALWQAVLEHRAIAQDGYARAIRKFEGTTERYFLPKAVPIHDGERLAGVTVILTDVTHLRNLDELKTDLISTASHEFKTPLTSLQMAIGLLLEERASGDTELLEVARADVDRLHRTVDDILDLSRIESGRVQMNLEATPVGELVREAVEAVRVVTQERGLKVEVRVDPAVGPVLADRERIGVVLNNLLSNALKYTGASGTIGVKAKPGRDFVQFEVWDTGEGIPEEHVPRVFDKFFRVPGQQKAGAGLGLAIAKDVVVAHGGEIRCESEYGKGTTFSFTLRCAEDPVQGAKHA
jgi:NtrC-family two-component system sensor histidine kinase KinB